MAVVYIYILCDPDTLDIRYVGKSIRPKQGLTNHLNESPICHRTNWLRSLKKSGKRPLGLILEEIKDGNWQEVERRWISYFRSKGCKLVNNTIGGDGVSGVSGEAKQRMLATWKGRKHKLSSKLKMSLASSSRRHSKETKARMSKAHRGRKITWSDKVSRSLRRFTDRQALRIGWRIVRGERICDLAREFGVHRTTISKITTGIYSDMHQGNKSRLRQRVD